MQVPAASLSDASTRFDLVGDSLEQLAVARAVLDRAETAIALSDLLWLARLDLLLSQPDNAGIPVEQRPDDRTQLILAEGLAEHDSLSESLRQSLPCVSGHEGKRNISLRQGGGKLLDG